MWYIDVSYIITFITVIWFWYYYICAIPLVRLALVAVGMIIYDKS